MEPDPRATSPTSFATAVRFSLQPPLGPAAVAKIEHGGYFENFQTGHLFLKITKKYVYLKNSQASHPPCLVACLRRPVRRRFPIRARRRPAGGSVCISSGLGPWAWRRRRRHPHRHANPVSVWLGSHSGQGPCMARRNTIGALLTGRLVFACKPRWIRAS